MWRYVHTYIANPPENKLQTTEPSCSPLMSSWADPPLELLTVLRCCLLVVSCIIQDPHPLSSARPNRPSILVQFPIFMCHCCHICCKGFQPWFRLITGHLAWVARVQLQRILVFSIRIFGCFNERIPMLKYIKI